jgi:two-component system chemotaxis response regulator CheV
MNDIQSSVDYMTKAHLRNVQQLAVFKTGNDNVYAINIAKVKSFVILDNISIYDTPTDTTVIEGIATVMDEPVTIINLDKWISKKDVDKSVYSIAIYCEYSGIQVAFLVKDVIDIMEKTTQELKTSDNKNAKVTYTTRVKIGDKEEICTIFNAEQLLEDIGLLKDVHAEIEEKVEDKIVTEKMILCAEDSAIAQKIIQQFFKKVDVKYEIYENGKLLLERLEELGKESIGLVITDIEMPIMDGYQVVSTLRSPDSKYLDIPVAVNSSMTSQAVVQKMKDLGADDFISKGDIKAFLDTIKKHLDVKIEE